MAVVWAGLRLPFLAKVRAVSHIEPGSSRGQQEQGRPPDPPHALRTPMTAQSRMHGQSSTDARKGGERRSLARTNPAADGAAIERVVARVGNLSEFTDAQIRQIA